MRFDDIEGKLRRCVERSPRLTQRQQWLMLEAADAIEALRGSRFGGQICKSHGQAVLVTHITDGKPCEDYLNAGKQELPPVPEGYRRVHKEDA